MHPMRGEGMMTERKRPSSKFFEFTYKLSLFKHYDLRMFYPLKKIYRLKLTDQEKRHGLYVNSSRYSNILENTLKCSSKVAV